MSKFNVTNTMKTTNRSGHVAYAMDRKTDLVTKVLNTFFNEKKFYGDTSNELVQLAEKTDMNFVANLAVYARKEMHLRSVAHVLTAIVARHGGGEFTRRAVAGVVERPDDILEIMAIYKQMYGKPWPNALKRQIAIEMNGFNEYEFAKYNGGNKGVKFKDVLKITHANPSNKEQDAVFNRIMNNVLIVPYTWETELSANGNNKETWEKLIDSGKVGYMALLRNLRNIIKANPSNINKVYSILADKERVQKSKQLPFRFYTAYNTLAKEGLATTKVCDVLEDAISASCSNIDKLPGKTLIAIDVSGSMYSSVSGHSDVQCVDIASILGAIAAYVCEDAEVVTFDDSLYHNTLSSRAGIISNANSLKKCGGGTDIGLPFEYILKNKKLFDRAIVISDNEINSQWKNGYRGWFNHRDEAVQKIVSRYRSAVNPNFWVHAIDLAGYGTQQFNGEKTNILAGWSDRVFEYIHLTENGLGGMVKTIENYHNR